MDMGEGGEKKMRRKGTLIAIRALIPCYMDEQKGRSVYSQIIECYLYRVHGVYMSYVFYNYNKK